MNITIIGTGYVGLVTGTCFAEMGMQVTCIDIDQTKIDRLNKGDCPIYEIGLEELIHKNIRQKRLSFSTSLTSVIHNTDVLFIAVGTPPNEDGSADLSYVLSVATEIGKLITDYKLIVVKSTVPIGTCTRVQATIQAELDKRNLPIPFDVASNPEFLKEGTAVKDFLSPDRIIVGTNSEKAKQILDRIYRPFILNNYRVIFMDIRSAEMTKYAANAMLATRISFMNEIANLCEKVGADVQEVRKGISADKRIGTHFLYPGCGYGGSCFPKDVKALIQTGNDHNEPLQILNAVEHVNQKQKLILYQKLLSHFQNNLQDKKIAIWGLAFKPETNDIREAPAIITIQNLITHPCQISVYDPIAIPETQALFNDRLTYCHDIYEAITDADALLLITEWKEFRLPDWQRIHKLMRTPLVLDGRNIYDHKELTLYGFTHIGIGKQA